MRRTAPLLVLVLLLAGCGEEEPAPEAAAAESLEQFKEALGDMDKKADDLSEQVDALEARFREDLEKHLTLLNDRLGEYEARIASLPADKEAALRQRFAQLMVRAGEVKELFNQWAAAKGDDAKALRTRLDASKAELDKEFDAFDAAIAEAEKA